MIWYIALVAIANLGLGYGLCLTMSGGKARWVSAGAAFGDGATESEFGADETEEWEG